jgi:ppGpp synthetase/RelA/SpoT-type nucleotidyltranferase
MSEIQIVRDFVEKERRNYINLAREVKKACQGVEAELGHDAVIRVYSRADKQGGDDAELKDTEKIFAACARPVTDRKLRDISDIVGVTIVVQYPDQVTRVLAAVAAKLGEPSYTASKPREHRGTYFATHQVFTSNAIGQRGLRCEVQCKTMLHDAWSAKMHDLTYKPQGSLDDRMKALIETISGTIEGLEQQSQIVRNMILARQNIERRPFRASLEALYEDLSVVLAEDWSDALADETIVSLRQDIHDQREHLIQCPSSDGHLMSIMARVDAAADDPKLLRVVWLLAARIASFRMGPEASRYLEQHVNRVFDRVGALRKSGGGLTEREIGALPLGYYAIQDFTRALASTDKILENADAWGLSPFRRAILKLNKLIWLLERESLTPSKGKKQKALKASVAKNLKELRREIRKLSKADIADLDTTVDGTEGLFLIVFGETKEDVRVGVERCIAALSGGEHESEIAVDRAYAEWRTQVGWRRYFDLAEREDDASARLWQMPTRG